MTASLAATAQDLLARMGVDASLITGGPLTVTSPIDGSKIGAVTPSAASDVSALVALGVRCPAPAGAS
jgi:aldehyde dehydrogenase (NAD+)